MEDRIYEEFNNVIFDEVEFNSIDASPTELELKKLRKDIKRRVNKVKYKHIKTAASIAVAAVIGITLATPAFAKTVGQNIPGIDSLYEKLGYYSEYKDFSQYIGISKEDKGYTFTIDKLIADNDTVLVALRVQKDGLNSGKVEDAEKSAFMMVADLGGIRIGTIMGGGMERKVLDKDTSLVLLENQAKPTRNLPKRFDLKVNIHSMFEGDVNVNFELPVSREKTMEKTIMKKNLGSSAVGDGLKVKLSALEISPLNTGIKYSYSGKLADKSNISLYMYDDKGRIYIENTGFSDDNGHSISNLGRIEETASKLYITPYVEFWNSADEKSLEKYKSLDFHEKYYSLDTIREFDFKEEGKLKLYKIEKANNTIKFYYSLKGFQSILNKRYAITLWEKKSDKPEDKEWISAKNAKLYKANPSEPDSYCLEFSNIDISRNYEYQVSSYSTNKVLEGKTIEVDLRK